MKNLVLRRGIALLIAVGLCTPALAVAASPSQVEVVSITVSYADLDIDNQAGAKTLYSRLQRAAANVCDLKTQNSAHESLTRRLERKRCYTQALASAVEEIDNKTLTTIYKG